MRTRLPRALHAAMSGQGQEQRYLAGDVLFQEGDGSDGLYLLLSGRLKVYATAADGREVIYSVLEAGELLGELSLDGGARTASVKAMSDAVCLLVKNSVARALMRAHPEFADHVLAKTAARARHSTRMARSIALDPVRERVVALLDAHAIPDGGLLRIPTELTQQEIADRIGASREMVHRIIRTLVREGALHKDAKHRMAMPKPLSENPAKTRRPAAESGD